MGRASREKPVRLGEKLLKIRTKLDLSQDGMLRVLGLAEKYGRHYISGFERGEREPPLLVLLRYSEVAKVWLNALVDDDVDLPEEIPSPHMHGGVRRQRASSSKRRIS
ncbi:MAG: Helix-turn-helix domain [Acidobacteriota bacterium]|jgi:transcriptional regulator with XRE-family HTH domain|nr:Helix-turn-helix domain [Acidobacteriota bacterium]